MLMTRHIGAGALSTAALILCLLGVCLLSGCPGARPTADDAGAARSPDREEPAVDYDNTVVEHDKGIVAVTNSSFEQVVLRSEVPVLLEFWAAWCEPCQMMQPVLEQIASKYGGKVLVATVNIADPTNGRLADEYAAQGIPTVVIIKGGKVTDGWVGYGDGIADVFNAALDEAVAE